MQEWDFIEEFHEGFIDLEGNTVVETQFDYVHDFSGGLALVNLPGDSNPHRYIDRSGAIVLDLLAMASVSESFDFHEGVTRAYDLLDMMGFVDKTGRWVIPPRDWRCLDFQDGRARVQMESKCGFTDHEGRIVIPLKFNDADSFVDGVARVKIGKSFRYINIHGNYVRKPAKK